MIFELEDTDEGLYFRLDLRRTKSASAVSRMVEVNSRACASVAYRVAADTTETYGPPREIVTSASSQPLGAPPRRYA
jgi:hypothetical protein